jgi:hypothetical protein
LRRQEAQPEHARDPDEPADHVSNIARRAAV